MAIINSFILLILQGYTTLNSTCTTTALKLLFGGMQLPLICFTTKSVSYIPYNISLSRFAGITHSLGNLAGKLAVHIMGKTCNSYASQINVSVTLDLGNIMYCVSQLFIMMVMKMYTCM